MFYEMELADFCPNGVAREDFSYVIATNFKEAATAFDDGAFDVILSDGEYQGNGRGFAKIDGLDRDVLGGIHLIQHVAASQIPFYFFTGNRSAIETRLIGADATKKPEAIFSKGGGITLTGIVQIIADALPKPIKSSLIQGCPGGQILAYGR
jgi:hypothetical protein